MKISVIVPVYNGYNYLSDCLDSILNQTIGKDNLEIIIVNDGSTDESELLIKKYQRTYKMIKLITQKNSGQAEARNKGLSLATGDFISFVDCDDTIELDMYQKMLTKLNTGDLDIVTCDYNIYYGITKAVYKFRFIDDENRNFAIMNTGPCNMLIRRSLLTKRNFKFPSGIIYEDFAVIPPLSIGTKIFHIEEPLYNYYKRDSSTMNIAKYSPKLNDIFESFEILKKQLEKYYPEECEFLFIKNVMMSASLRFINFKDPENKITYISSYAKKYYPNWQHNKYFKTMQFKKKIVAYLTYWKLKKILYLLNKLNRRNK